jgi:hypothetical protein
MHRSALHLREFRWTARRISGKAGIEAVRQVQACEDGCRHFLERLRPQDPRGHIPVCDPHAPAGISSSVVSLSRTGKRLFPSFSFSAPGRTRAGNRSVEASAPPLVAFLCHNLQSPVNRTARIPPPRGGGRRRSDVCRTCADLRSSPGSPGCSSQGVLLVRVPRKRPSHSGGGRPSNLRSFSVPRGPSVPGSRVGQRLREWLRSVSLAPRPSRLAA